MQTLAHLENLLTSNKISRREFIARASALGLSAAVAPALFASKAGAATPKTGGHFVQALSGGSTTDTLDPATHTSSWNINVEWQLRNSLVEIDHNFQPIPELAESWEATPDAKKWIIKLRKGVEFHDGKTLDADDVIYSLNHHRGPDSKSAAKPYLDPVESLTKDDKYTLVFQLNTGVADWPFILGDYHLAIFKNGTKGTEFDKGIGTGAFLLEKWEPGVVAVTKRNPNYWKAGRGHFDSVETLAINDVNARTNAIKTGRIHLMDRVERKTVHLLKRSEGLRVTTVTGTYHYTMPMIVEIPPYDNNDVRLALKYACNREEMVKRILNGYGEAGNDHPIAPTNRYHASDIPQRAYDPDKAKFHMKKAGMLDHTFDLHTSEAAYQGADDCSILYQEHAKKAGIKINVVREPGDGYWSDVWTKKGFCQCYWSGRPTEDLMFSVAYAGGAPWNDTRWNHPRFNELLVAAKAELDEKKRAQMYAEMQLICRDEGATIVPMFAQIIEAESDKIAHGPLAAYMESDGHRNTERWWFA